ncbi:MAG: hypothetical protein K2Y40_09495 [Reyranella sp.]|nr:hypothetical protein [Reyranella sp.]
MRRRGVLHRAAVAALLVAVSVAAGLAVLEGLTRLLFPAFDPSGQIVFDHAAGPLMLARPGSAVRQAKNTGDFDVAVAINRHGLRDAKDIARATADDLAVVGDSFAWGWGVEATERFSDQLERLTGRTTYNLATPADLDGYGALLDYAKSLGARIGQVVVAVCLENDLHLYGTDAPSDDDVGRPSWKGWLTGHSAAYRLLTTVAHQTPWLKTLAVHAGAIVPNLKGISRNSYAADVIDSSADRLAAIGRQYRLLVVLIPSRALWVGDNRAVEDRVHAAFAAALAQRGVRVLDLRPLFEAGGTPLAFHFANDGHWNARGHRLAAEAVARCLTQPAGNEACR